MAENYSTQDVGGQDVYPVEQGASLGSALNVLGAAASLVLIVGIGVWGYQLVMRDVSGVPVVRALEGPMRAQPVDPGGEPADHQGLAVNAVAAQGTAEAPADRLILAPRPVDLVAEDQPRPPNRPEVAATVAQTSDNQASPDTAAADAVTADQQAVDEFETGTVQSMVDRLIAEVMPAQNEQADTTVVQVAARIVQPAPLSDDPDDLSASVQTDTAEDVIAAVITGPGVAQSLRPRPRPARAAQPVAVAAAVAKPALDVSPEDVPEGTRLAQLGAFESPEVAMQEWDRLSGRFRDYLDGKSRVIQKTSSGGRIFYRLRAMGFEDLSDARRFCSVLVAEKADCIPVVAR